MTPITSFSGEYRWLSNFWPCHLPPMYGIVPPTAEHAYQAQKSSEEWYAIEILRAPTAGVAKRLGKGAKLQADWDDLKIDVMRQILGYKFDNHNPELQAKLLATGDVEIIEGNTWGDVTWGCVMTKAGWVGENNLGKLLMEIRKELRGAHPTPPA